MATGYTFDVKDGKVTDFRTFALRCSRAFGACIMQRDDDMKDEPKHRERSDFYDDLLRKSTARLKELLSMTLDQAAVLEKAERDSRSADIARMRQENETARERYESMLADVRSWKPPTAQHVGLRDFMIEQLTTSIDHDCMDPARYMPTADPVDPKDWLTKQIADERRNVERYAGEVAKEDARVRDANDWIDALYASLPETKP